MRMLITRTIWLWGLLVLTASSACAEDLLMVRSQLPFPEAMATLQESIDAHGYKVARVQRVDIGLKGQGFKTDKYRVVFFGKPKEIDTLAKEYPKLIPYLPPKIAIFAENGQTILVTSNPALFKRFYPDPKLAAHFDRWARDFRAILDDVRKAQ
ncbi:MAG: DUF302 domain-containing protein [Gammaproteobacteria bacterium]|jgi:uncharacterized protein (DUF302 family)